MEDNGDTAYRCEESTTKVDSGAEIVTASMAAPAVKALWPGVLFWLALSVTCVGLGVTDVADDLWFATLILVLVSPNSAIAPGIDFELRNRGMISCLSSKVFAFST
jgi:hypothetical protein